MKRATTSVAGFVAIVSGSATCWIRASFITTIRSAIESASSWLCVTWMNISPSWRCRLRSSTRMRSCSSRSRSPSGSSSRRAFGFVTSTRARATRCCCPPERALGFRSAERLQADHLERLHRRLPPLLLADAVHLETELDVLERRPVREEREVLEDRRRRALVRRQVDQRHAVEQDLPLRRVLVPSDHPQRRRLPAAGRAEQDDVLAVIDVKVDVIDCDGSAGEHLRQSDEIEPWLTVRGGGLRRPPGCRPLVPPCPSR